MARPPKPRPETVVDQVCKISVLPGDLLVVRAPSFRPVHFKRLDIWLKNQKVKKPVLVVLGEGETLESLSVERAKEILERIANA